MPILVRSATYPDGASDAAVTLLEVREVGGGWFPIGPIYPRSFGLRTAVGRGMALRPAEVVSLPPGSYRLLFADRDDQVLEVSVRVGAEAEAVTLDLVFDS